MELMVNGRALPVPEPWREDTLLMVLREVLGLVGAKFGCGQAQCGACTVWLDGAPVRSCVTPVAAAGGARSTSTHPVAAIANAIHAATGVRVARLPVLPDTLCRADG